MKNNMKDDRVTQSGGTGSGGTGSGSTGSGSTGFQPVRNVVFNSILYWKDKKFNLYGAVVTGKDACATRGEES